MTTRISAACWMGLWVVMPLLWGGDAAHAQRPQDNWYYDSAVTKTGSGLVATNGGLSQPYGIAVSSDGMVYVVDEGHLRVQAYQPDGTHVFSITNGFGGGKTFSQPRGMVFDKDGNLYIADYGRHAVYVFTKQGEFVRQVGNGYGTGDGQLSNPLDVGVSRDGKVYVLCANCYVSAFAPDGTFLRKWGGQGTLTSQFDGPKGLAVAPDGRVFVCQVGTQNAPSENAVKVFTPDGIYVRGFVADVESGMSRSPSSIRFLPNGLLLVTVTTGNAGAGWEYTDYSSYAMFFTTEAANLLNLSFSFGPSIQGYGALSPVYSAVGPNGMMYVLNRVACKWMSFRQALREVWLPPYNAIPMAAVLGMQQRPNSTLVDIDYQVTDMDDTNVHTAALVFKNATQAISNCIRNLTLAEGTATNLGPGIAANQPHRITWNAGVDWGTSLSLCRAAILARDSRSNLLDVHYLRLPAGNGMPALTISRSPLIANDYMQAWWWLLATGDGGIGLSTNRIVGVGGAYDAQVLCDGTNTSAGGRSYVHAKMNVREATPTEVDWARQASLPGNTNRWTSTFSVSGRPAKVNEFGFDTGNWGSSAFWVVPLD